jgi:hypothetical protein
LWREWLQAYRRIGGYIARATPSLSHGGRQRLVRGVATHSADADAVSTCDLWYAGRSEERVKVSNAGALAALAAESEDGPLLGAR